MGTLGESYSILNRLIPYSTRIFQIPSQMYDGMIYVAKAKPTEIWYTDTQK